MGFRAFRVEGSTVRFLFKLPFETTQLHVLLEP